MCGFRHALFRTSRCIVENLAVVCDAQKNESHRKRQFGMKIAFHQPFQSSGKLSVDGPELGKYPCAVRAELRSERVRGKNDK